MDVVFNFCLKDFFGTANATHVEVDVLMRLAQSQWRDMIANGDSLSESGMT